MANKSKYDTTKALNQIETGRIITILRKQGIRLKYRELIGFSPADVAGMSVCKTNRIAADDIAEMAKRDPISKQEVES